MLIGESGSGKSEIVKRLGYPENLSYTTRDIRAKEVGQVPPPYRFVNDQEYLRQKESGLIFEESSGGTHHYWTSHSDYDFEGVKLFIADVEGVYAIEEKIKDRIPSVVINISSDRHERYSRLMNDYWFSQGKLPEFYHREHAEKAVESRMSRDDGRFDMIPCDYVVSNNIDIDHAVSLVQQIIQKELDRE